MKNILFLCTGNSARSIMAEAYMSHASRGQWRAYSAGSKPTGAPNRFALETLAAHNIPIDFSPRSKSWDEFADERAPAMDVIATVCDNAASEACPVWPTQNGKSQEKLHWSFPDPAAAAGNDEEIRAAFVEVFASIRNKIDNFLTESAA